VGGFDSRWEGIEDIELGYRLHASGYRLRLDRELQVCHLKRWTLRSMVTTDFTMRGVPWSRLIRSRRFAPNDLNVRQSQRASVGLVGIGLATAAIAPVWPIALLPALLAAVGVCFLNWSFYTYLAQCRGAAFAVRSIPLHFLYFLVAGAAFAYTAVLGSEPNGPAAS
jgi:hypothetical protein